jgi:uncharacterized protein YndB with AHSA1/START domain
MARTDVIFEPGRQDIIIRREFDAPRDVVFKAFTDPALIPRWWGSRRFSTVVDRRTRYVNVSLFQSVEDRDGWIPTDMDKGIRESMDLIDELISGA